MGNTLVQLLIGLISGGVGGNIAGAILKKYSLGPLGNTIVGLLGGGIGEQLFNVAGLLQNGGFLADVAVPQSAGASSCSSWA
jgi:uncharacterized membrane protein YeaQ/YmgE (transglycosylase-associated protein family)